MRLISILCVFSLASVSLAQRVAPGSVAPKLDVKQWFKGTPTSRFEKERTYIVELWATWCGPCIENMPHLSKIAKANPDVTVLGISILERSDGTNIQKFVDQMGDKMSYNVGWSGDQEGMSKTWLKAAAQNGIPASFIVKDGVIQWIGHPADLEEPLAQIKAGTFDLATHRAEFIKIAQRNESEAATERESQEIERLFSTGKRKEAHRRLDALARAHPDRADTVANTKFFWLARENPKAWRVQAEALATSNNRDQLRRLLSFAIRQQDPKTGLHAQAELALELAIKGTKGMSWLPYKYATLYYEGTKQWDKALKMVAEIERLLPTMSEQDRQAWGPALAEAKQRISAQRAK